MRDILPKQISNKVERGVLNLDVSKSNGIQWVCYYKNKDTSYYFDSFGLDTSLELQNYLNPQIELSTFQINAKTLSFKQ